MLTGEQGFYSVNILLNCSLTNLTLKALSVSILQSPVAASLCFCSTDLRLCFGTRVGKCKRLPCTFFSSLFPQRQVVQEFPH